MKESFFINFGDLITIEDTNLLWYGETSREVIPLSLSGWKYNLATHLVLLILFIFSVLVFSFIDFSFELLIVVILTFIGITYKIFLSPIKIEYGITKECVYIKSHYLYGLRNYHIKIVDIVKPSLLIFNNNPFGTIVLMTKVVTGVTFRDIVSEKSEIYPSIQYIEQYNEVYDILIKLKNKPISE